MEQMQLRCKCRLENLHHKGSSAGDGAGRYPLV